MNGEASSSSAAELKIHFIIVGGGIAGLSAALALTRVGHRVTLLEKGDSKSNRGPGGLHLAPNGTKVLFHWGLKDSLKAAGLTSHPLLFSQYHTGQLLGIQLWDDELLRETRGEFLLMTHGNLCEILHDAAVSQGAEIRYNAKVVDIEPEDGAVKLASGEILQADIIIGADGERGLCRRLVLGREERIEPSGLGLFDLQFGSQTATQEMAQEEKRLLEKVQGNPVYVAMGNSAGATGYPIHQGREIAFHFFFRAEFPLDGGWDDPPTAKPELLRRLRRNGPQQVTRVALNKYEELDDWVHESGRLLVIGQAAHPIPHCGIQVASVAIEDAAVLGKLPPEAALRGALDGEVSMITFITTPDGPEQDARNANMRAKYRAGKNVLEGDTSDGGEGEQWVQIRTIFGYDCEDEADNWWVQWGLLRARANSDGQNRQSQMGVFSWSDMTVLSVDESTS
ncbi:hypothetical protein EVJ58_g9715 [Rhodofomes roseus]|uniref:FAD-binding domain-containing protein n=1 Tax=Rhodofomes roseus TaxID=34475 RepID=A0A4Y9XUA5_9APHY|nr:hypothetical protein EVJ58_g9715 [Rhodofomes roseus]